MKLAHLKILLMLSPFWLASFLMQSCNSDEPALKAFAGETAHEEYLSQKIAEKNFYIIYGWTTWCDPCGKTIKEKLPVVQSYLDSTGANVGIMAICADDRTSKSFFELHDFMDSLNIESYLLETRTFSLHDRWALNGYFGKTLSDYEDSRGVPIVLIQDLWLAASKGRPVEVIQDMFSK